MVEIISSESCLEWMLKLLGKKHSLISYRKTLDGDGYEYHVLINGSAEEIAEWREDICAWCLIDPPSSSGTMDNSHWLAPVMSRIQEQQLLMRLRTAGKAGTGPYKKRVRL